MRPRIIILSAFATPLRSGAEACAEEIPVQLKDHYDFVIITARMRRDVPKHDHLQGIPVERVGLGFSIDKWLYPFLAAWSVRKYKPQIVHAILETFAGLALHFCRFTMPSAKRVLTLQTTNRNFLKGFIIRSAQYVTAISSVLMETAKAHGRDDAVHIPNGIDVRGLHSAAEHHQKIPGRILFVGRLEQMKGVDTLLDALARVASPDGSAPPWHLHIIGDGSKRPALEYHAHFVFTKGNVQFLGYMRPPALYREYAQAEIFCCLSRSEALGNVFLEAQAAGCAVLGTTVGGIPDIVQNGETGILVSPDDVEAAADALRILLCDGNLRTRLGNAGEQHVAPYAWETIAQQYGKIYDGCLSA